jgi:hypothetical protein
MIINLKPNKNNNNNNNKIKNNNNQRPKSINKKIIVNHKIKGMMRNQPKRQIKIRKIKKMEKNLANKITPVMIQIKNKKNLKNKNRIKIKQKIQMMEIKIKIIKKI